MTMEEWAKTARNSMAVLSELPDGCKAMANLAAIFSQARNEALEEAARVAEDCRLEPRSPINEYIAAAIRALKDEQQ